MASQPDVLRGAILMGELRKTQDVGLFLKSALLVSLLIFASPAASEVRLLKGQTVYVPAYSHIYHGDRFQPFYLEVTLSVRNTDPVHSISIVSIDYFDSAGKLLTKYLPKETMLGAMASAEYIVKESDRAGGTGAKFIVVWQSEARVSEPIIESVMISTRSQQGISFSSRGQAIKEE
jgi:hypothetical protein